MKIAGLQKNSFVDYRGKVAAVVFTAGCNMDCYFCHNRGILCENGLDLLSEEEVLSFLSDRKKFLDGVVITGGEPTLQRDLKSFILKVKSMGYPVKLDTNGTNPAILENLMMEGLVDYIAMDIKAPLHRYSEICGVQVDTNRIKWSIELLMNGNVEYEFRTTLVPELSGEDVYQITETIKGASAYILQQYRRPQHDTDVIDYRLLKQPHSSVFIRDLTDKVAPCVQRYETRGVV